MSVSNVIREARLEAAQGEWERWKRVVGVAAAGIRASVAELRKTVETLDVDRAQRRDLERQLALIAETVTEMDSENWLKSPRAMDALRRDQETR